MPALHIIDAARIAHETRRRFFAESTAREVTASWSDLPEDRRAHLVGVTQRVIDKEHVDEGAAPSATEAEGALLWFSVVNALRPFLEE